MVLFLSITGVFLSVLLISFSARSYRSSVYLGLFFLFISFYGLYQYVLLYSHSESWIKVFLFLIPLLGTSIYLIGPVLFWYVRSVINDSHRLRMADLWHLLPAAVFLLAALPGMFSPANYLSEAAAAIAQNPDSIGNFKPTLLSSLVSYPVLFLSRPLLILGYTCASIIMLINYLLRHDKTSVFPGQSFMARWLIILLGSFFILLVSQILILLDFTTGTFHLSLLLRILQLISLTALIGLLVSPFFFPGILYGLPRYPLIEKETVPDHLTPPTHLHDEGRSLISDFSTAIPVPETNISKPTSPGFESEYLNLIGKQAEQAMQDFQPYLQPDFNLTRFSVLVNIPAHHLAYYFREVKKLSFTDFRNRWRVQHAKNLIRAGKSTELTLEAIGILSGFSSRNAFLNAFKKAEGISPNVFRAQINESIDRELI